MASVYILYSLSLNKYYTGSCKELSERLEMHFSGEKQGAYTTKANDWTLYFSMNELGYEQARQIEKHIKRMKSRNYIENLKKYKELSQNLIKRYQ